MAGKRKWNGGVSDREFARGSGQTDRWGRRGAGGEGLGRTGLARRCRPRCGNCPRSLFYRGKVTGVPPASASALALRGARARTKAQGERR